MMVVILRSMVISVVVDGLGDDGGDSSEPCDLASLMILCR